MLQNRVPALLALAQAQASAQGYAYTRIAIGPAVEAAILDLEWTFWQYYGVADCSEVPAIDATDAAMFEFLDRFSQVSSVDDAETAEFEAYFYQAYSQIGSPGTVSNRGDLTDPALQQYRQYSDADFVGAFPIGVAQPVFDPEPMQDIQTWIASEGSHFVFEYGEYDPWTGGKYDIGDATDTIELTSPQGTHNDGLSALTTTDRAAAYAKLQAWTGVTPVPVSMVRATPRRHRHGL